ncbi:hypothetical protein PV762_02280 [Mitsuaria sp. CC2]|uniref:hypothetical protein n=1 Tax=Mitsuaria sp. CC2 TaxID=3029186 RepID=UPI003B8B71C2
MKLNGWQRLWVVLSAVWLAFTLVGFSKEVPGDQSARRNAEAQATSELRAPDQKRALDCILERGPLPNYDEHVACEIKSRDLTPAEQRSLQQRIAELLPEAKSALRGTQVQMLAAFLGLWLVGILLLYGLGWIAAWVVRGFKQKAN